ncbi:MAG: DsbA family protein [Firmicutes bacterium]|nr:DsbA family protein [Bacillota bacterium]
MNKTLNQESKFNTSDESLKDDFKSLKSEKDVIDLYYFTDPLCSHCWALDSTLSRFKLEYKDYLNIITVMGGMIEDGNHYQDLQGEEAKSQASHWEDVGLFYHIPMNSNVWHKNPITSSFPSSIIYLILKKQDEIKAATFLRMVREKAFVFETNVANKEELIKMLQSLQVPYQPIIDLAFSKEGKKILLDNFQPMIDLGVSGFPTVVFVNKQNEGIKVVGARTIETYKKALLKIMKEGTVLEPNHLPTLKELLDVTPTIFYYEIEKMYDLKVDEIQSFITKNLAKDSYKTDEIVGYSFIQKV